MIYRGSRYTRTKKRIRGSRKYLTNYERVNFAASKCVTYQWQESDTIDGLAYKLYGSADLWWCIMDANRTYMSELEIKAGDIILLPPFSEVQKVVG